jgi:SAM-dependent methyltransferase
MRLRTGVPLITELQALQSAEAYREHLAFNESFLARHNAALRKYGRHWGMNPFRLWSRRWEYPFVAARLVDFCEQWVQRLPGDEPIEILDAGSGVTYFPYFICARVPRARFICCDYDTSYQRMFDEINALEPQPPRVVFRQAMLQKLPMESQSLGAICCISVLEHTDNYAEIVDEFCRVLRPGGALLLTFDLSLDGRFTLPKATAAELLRKVLSKFEVPDAIDLLAELDRMHADGVLTTDHVRRTEPEFLPWSNAVKLRNSVQDFFKGFGWTGGFRSRTVFCLEVRKPTR